jgi:hypothetical protein
VEQQVRNDFLKKFYTRLQQKLSQIQKYKNAEYFVYWCWVFLAQKNLESSGSAGWALEGAKFQKREFGAQNQYGRVIYPSIGNFTCSKKKIYFWGSKRSNKPSEPKNGILGPKINMAVWYIHRLWILHGARKNIILGGRNGENKPSGPKNGR